MVSLPFSSRKLSPRGLGIPVRLSGRRSTPCSTQGCYRYSWPYESMQRSPRCCPDCLSDFSASLTAETAHNVSAKTCKALVERAAHRQLAVRSPIAVRGCVVKRMYRCSCARCLCLNKITQPTKKKGDRPA